jgi:serine/threonine protein kinase
VGGEGGRRADESQSDIGEDWAGRGTEDERENGSTSGRSGSRQSWNAGHAMTLTRTASGRSSAGEEEVGACAAAAAKKPSPHFANIPEESEKEKEAVASSQQQHLTTETSQTATSDDSTWVDGSAEGSKAEAAPANKSSPNRRRKSDRPRSDKVTVDDFEMIRVLGKGCAGKVLLVRHKPTTGLFAMKSIHKRHVLAHQELQHTLTEQAVLKRMAREALDPFCVKLWWSFHDKQNLYLVMDFHPGGDLATQLSRWGRLGRDRARFYAAEIVEGVEGLHKAGVIYRDLKPENVLIAADGHIVLSDFGLSKEFPDRRADRVRERGCTTPPPLSPPRSNSSRDLTTATAMTATSSGMESTKTRRPPWVSASEEGTSTAPSIKREERDMTTTFCGTAEYLAPEVIQGAAYSYEVDWWSFGTMLYEFLVGVTPFWADTHADMYIRVLHDDLVFPEDRVLDSDTKGFLRGLLQRNPMLRMKEPRIKKHPYFSMIEWDHVYHKRYIPPYVPPINPLDETDTQNFDEAFLDMQPVVQDDEDDAETVDPEQKQSGDDDGDAGTRVGHGDDESAQRVEDGATQENGAVTTASPLKPSEALAKSLTAADGKSLFDGYSFRGRKDSGSVHSSFRSESIDSDLASELVASELALENTLRSARGDAASSTFDPPLPERSPTPTPAEAYAHSQLEAERKTPVAPGSAALADLPRSSTTVRPSDDALYRRVSVDIPIPAMTTSSLPAMASPTASPMLSAAPPLFQPVPQRPRKEEIFGGGDEVEANGEDDDTATREAVFALAALEQQASQDQSVLSADGATTTSTLASSAAGHDAESQARLSKSYSRGVQSTGALPTTREETVGDADDEDDGEEEEEWDLVDAAVPSSASGRGLPSDVNGGKGQNLFARGVVDTYRMLRRQDSMRPTGGSASGSGTIPPRPFSRLANRRKGANASTEMTRPSKADLKSGSVVSLDSSGNVASNRRGSAVKDAPSKIAAEGGAEGGGRRPSEGAARASAGAPGADSTSDSARPSGEAAAAESSVKAMAASTIPDLNGSSFAAVSSPPSAAAAANAANASAATAVAAAASNGGSAHTNGNGDLQKRQSRIRRRFTTFFEQAAR